MLVAGLAGVAVAGHLRASSVESGSLRLCHCWLCHLLAFGQDASDLSKPQFPHLENGDENTDFIAVRVEWRIRQQDTCVGSLQLPCLL